MEQNRSRGRRGGAGLLPTAAASLVVTAALAFGALPASAATPAAPAGGRVALAADRASVPVGAVDEGATTVGGALTIQVYLGARDQAGLVRLAQEVATPGDPHYRHFLTPAQYGARFAPTAAQTQAVRAWLTGCGLTVTAADRHALRATGDQAAVQCAVGAGLHAFRWRGRTLHAPAGALTVPRAVAADVLSVSGLSGVSAEVRPASAQHVAARRSSVAPAVTPAINTATCSSSYGANPATTLPTAYGATQPWQVCGYLPAQLRGAYGVTGTGLTGAGVTVAVVDAYASASIASDVQTYASRHGEASWGTGQLTQDVPSGLAAQPLAWQEEESMDVEAVHAMAPGADVVYVATADGQDASFVDALSRIVDNHLADIVAGSWVLGADNGVPQATEQAFQQDFLQGAVEGIGFDFASGDNGSQAASSDGAGPLVTAPQFPASSPWVTAVGGSTLAVDAGGQYQWETGWETDYAKLSADGTGWTGLPGSFAGGSGGGQSTVFQRPLYQQYSVSVAPAGGFLGRTVPDVAMDADPVTGMLVGQTFTFPTTGSVYVEYASGGSSLAAPLFAGIQALAQQHAGRPLGFANPSIYHAAARGGFRDITDAPTGTTTTPPAAVHTVLSVSSTGTLTTSYVLASFGRAQDAGLAVAPGYDEVTGVGTPTPGWFGSVQ